jgi:predicted RNase H-like HicB family nuclease
VLGDPGLFFPGDCCIFEEDVPRRHPQRSVEDQMKFLVTLDRDEDGVWVAECPQIPGCVSQGKTKDEAVENVQDAIRACLEVRAAQGMPLTIEVRQVDVAA